MHLMKDYENRIMYGDRNIQDLLNSAIHGKPDYENYCNCDIKQTKEVSNMLNKVIQNYNPRMMRNAGTIYAVINGKAYTPEIVTVKTGFRENMEYEFSVAIDPRYEVVNTAFAIHNVIFNPPATIVFWGDGSKTVVKCQNGEEFDPEKGLTMAFFKRMHGNKGRYFDDIKKWSEKYAVNKHGNNSKSNAGVEVTFTFKDWNQAAKASERLFELAAKGEV